MAKTVVGLFDSFVDAQEAVQDLLNHGFSKEDLNLIANDAEGKYARELGLHEADSIDSGDDDQHAGHNEHAGHDGHAGHIDNETEATDAAAAGAGVGATIGGIGGLLLGLGAFMIGGIGPVLLAGPLLAALGGAGIGAVTGGLVGSLSKAGIEESDANVFAEGVRRGGTLVVVSARDETADQAAELLNRHHPVDINQRSSAWKAEQWTGFNESAEPYVFDHPGKARHERAPASQLDYGSGARSYISGQAISDYDRTETEMGNYQDRTSDWRTYESRFREDFQRRYLPTGQRWEDYRDIYRYGFERAQDPRYSNAEWEDIRDDLRREWQAANPDGDWTAYESAVYEAWRAGRTPR